LPVTRSPVEVSTKRCTRTKSVLQRAQKIVVREFSSVYAKDSVIPLQLNIDLTAITRRQSGMSVYKIDT